MGTLRCSHTALWLVCGHIGSLRVTLVTSVDHLAVPTKHKSRLSLSTQVLLGFALGMAIEVFCGEKVACLQVGGKAFMQLLQMTVLPSITLSSLDLDTSPIDKS